MGGRESVLALNNQKPVDPLSISFPSFLLCSSLSPSLSSLFCARCSQSIPRGAPKHPIHNRWGSHSLGSCCGANAWQGGRKSVFQEIRIRWFTGSLSVHFASPVGSDPTLRPSKGPAHPSCRSYAEVHYRDMYSTPHIEDLLTLEIRVLFPPHPTPASSWPQFPHL